MYKIIYNDQVIDVLKKPKYIKFLKNSNRIAMCDVSEANGVLSSNNKEIYALSLGDKPDSKDWKVITIVEIDTDEYEKILSRIKLKEKICLNKEKLNTIRNEKIEELKKECNQYIVKGISVRLSDARFHLFDLTIEDQINLSEIEAEMISGKKSFFYHEKNKQIKEFSLTDMRKILIAAKKHKKYHTTYFNLMKASINEIMDVEKIRNIKYGDEIPHRLNAILFSKIISEVENG